MADNINVAPSEEATAVPVRTIEIGLAHYPVFILSNEANEERL